MAWHSSVIDVWIYLRCMQHAHCKHIVQFYISFIVVGVVVKLANSIKCVLTFRNRLIIENRELKTVKIVHLYVFNEEIDTAGACRNLRKLWIKHSKQQTTIFFLLKFYFFNWKLCVCIAWKYCFVVCGRIFHWKISRHLQYFISFFNFARIIVQQFKSFNAT